MLRALREGRSWTRKEFVAEFRSTAIRMGFTQLGITTKTLERWEKEQPPPQPRLHTSLVLQRMFDCELSDLGFANVAPATFQYDGHWPPNSVDLAASVDSHGGVNRREFVIGGASLSAFVLSRILLDPSAPSQNAGRRSLGMEEVECFRNVAQYLRSADAREGSGGLIEEGLTRTAEAVDSLRVNAYTAEVGRELLLTAADVASLTGWLLFDAGYDARAQRVLLSALSAARQGGDDLLSSTVLAFLSIQKLNLCEWEDARILAKAARKLVGSFDAPNVVASLLTREARAYAGSGEESRAYNSMDRAFELFTKGPGEDHPPSVTWVTEGELHGQWATAALLLGDVTKARREIQSAVNHYGEEANRSSSLHLLRLAAGLCRARILDEACVVADVALDIGDDVSSYRFDEVKGDLAAYLSPFKKVREVAEFAERHDFVRRTHLPRSTASLLAGD